MDFGQFAAAAVVVGLVLVVSFARYLGDGALANSAQRAAGYFGAGVLVFGLVSCVLVSAGVSIHFS